MKDLFWVITAVTAYISLYPCTIITVNNDTNLKAFTWNTSRMYTETSTTMLESNGFPIDCSQRQKRKMLYKEKSSRLKKCCVIGEGLNINEKNQSRSLCSSTHMQFTANLVNVTLYDNCIEDMETEFVLPIEIGNPCNTSMLYNEKDDLFFIVQDGSLLLMDLNGNDTYALYNNYCTDVNNISGIRYAVVCLNSIEENITRSQISVVAVLMLISSPCLLLITYLQFRIRRQMRTLCGITLSSISACIATGYILYSFIHVIKNGGERNLGYAAQFFMMSYYFWFLSLCFNVNINIM